MTAEATITARLGAIEGFDLDGTLHNLNGQLPALLRVLRRFADTYRDGEPRLLAAAQALDAKAGWQVCHALRGACAALCATQLVACIEAYEAALSSGAAAPEMQVQATRLQAELLGLARRLDAELGA